MSQTQAEALLDYLDRLTRGIQAISETLEGVKDNLEAIADAQERAHPGGY